MSVDDVSTLNRKFDLIYADPPFGLQRDFNMQEKNGEVKGFSDNWNTYEDYLEWYGSTINNLWDMLSKDSWMYLQITL